MSEESDNAPRKRGRPRKQVNPNETDKTHPLGPGHMVVELDCDDTGCGQLVCLSEKWWHVHIQKVGRVSKVKDGFKCNVTIQPTGAPTIT